MTTLVPGQTDFRYKLAWWNVENLFDAENADRDPELRKTISADLVGWTEECRDRKIANLSVVISLMNNGQGPDILGVCETENRHVLELLVKELQTRLPARQYGIAHADSPDKRGIDIAFIYDAAKFQAEHQFSLQLVKRSPTRDLFQVNFRVRATQRLFVVIGNHWPSRRGGQLESEPYRILAAETLSYWLQRIHEIVGPEAVVVCLGDFNDEPFNRSLVDFALSSRSRDRVLHAETPMLYNLMWPILGQRLGSHFFDEPNVFDQILVTRGALLPHSPFRVLEETIKLESENMLDHRVSYPKPSRMSLPSNHGYYPKGFSDHFPVSVTLVELLHPPPPAPPATPAQASRPVSPAPQASQSVGAWRGGRGGVAPVPQKLPPPPELGH